MPSETCALATDPTDPIDPHPNNIAAIKEILKKFRIVSCASMFVAKP
jgi:hypothetical protein